MPGYLRKLYICQEIRWLSRLGLLTEFNLDCFHLADDSGLRRQAFQCHATSSCHLKRLRCVWQGT